MKFIHISDLHIGKRVNEFSMLEDQEYILKKIIEVVDLHSPDAVFIAGDVYDKSVPSAEAIELFDEFLYALSKRNLRVFVISGNHDSPERLAFGGRLMHKEGIYISPVYSSDVSSVSFYDEYGKVNVYMLPFIKPAHVRRFFEQEDIQTYTDAMRVSLKNICLNENERNILITHQFVTGADRTQSEEISVGGSDNVDVSVFEKFDYVALGHIHRMQKCSYDFVRYSGSPLKYSFSEANDTKCVIIGELKEKSCIDIKTYPLVPLRDMVEIKGKYDDIMLRSFYENTSYKTDYLHITLTDEEDIPDAVAKLSTVYTNLMKLDYDNIRTRSTGNIDSPDIVENKTPYEHFADFFEKQNNKPMSPVQNEFIKDMIEEIWEGDV